MKAKAKVAKVKTVKAKRTLRAPADNQVDAKAAQEAIDIVVISCIHEEALALLNADKKILT